MEHVRAFLTPRWLGRHALLLVALVVLGRIGWWQFETARAEDDWQNYGYAVQWWLFGGFAVFLWVKLILDQLDPARLEQDDSAEASRPAVVQPSAAPPGDDEDDDLAEYNRHLAWLAEHGRS